MKRTRKWAFVEQEAKRLVELGLTPIQIARRLGVNKATIHRWQSTGKLERRTNAKRVMPGQTPEQWAATVRKDFALDGSDDQLVLLGERSLEIALDVSLAPAVRLTAMGRFQSVVRQLSLVTRRADEMVKDEPKKPELPRRTGTDPRTVLMAIK